MRIAIDHSLTAAEVRHRLKTRAPEIAEMVPGGLAKVTTSWPDENRMEMTITAMGKEVSGHVEICAHEAVFIINLTGSLSFVAPMIAAKVEEKGRKLLA